MLSLGIGLITAALTVSYRDVQYILPVFLQMLTYASPVAYSMGFALKKIHERAPVKYQHLLETIYQLNPMAAPLESFRAAVLGDSPWPATGSLVYATVFSVGMIIVGAYSFKKMERKFADII
jgi:lipopolysaccharide transport system permease protein